MWRRQPKKTVTVHFDQGSQSGSYNWQTFLKAHNLQQRRCGRGNCHHNALAKSSFQLLKRERIRRKDDLTRDTAGQWCFNGIGLFNNEKRCCDNSNR